MTKPLVVIDLGTSKDRRQLQGGKMFSWTIINDVPRGIANSTGAVGIESITMSPVMTETTLVFVTILFPHRSILLFTHTRCLLTWRGRRHSYINTSYLFICTLSSFCFFDLHMDIANS